MGTIYDVEQIRTTARYNRHKYICTNGMNPEEAIVFKSLIEELSLYLDKKWYKGNCRYIPAQTGVANKIMSYASRNLFDILLPKRYIHNHFFWASALSRTSVPVILDPTGVLIHDTNEIVPYFGLLSEAPESHKRVYNRMEDMDDWGTREFPPYFHP